MSWLEICAVILAGVWAGAINTLVGSGTLVTFPTLLAIGVPAVTANVSNSIGLVAGGVSGTVGYLPEMKGMGGRVLRLVPMSAIGAVTGALLLLWLPPEAFEKIVPALIGLGIVLVVFGPRLQAWSRAHHEDGGPTPTGHLVALMVGVLLAGIYGGYFGAAQGVILIGLLSALSTDPLQSLTGVKNMLGLVVNAIGALVFIITASDLINWLVVLLIAVGSLIGGVLGARYGRRLPPNALRAVIVVVGVAGLVKFVFFP